MLLAAGAVWLTWAFLNGGFRGGRPVRAVFAAPGVGQQLPEGGDVKVRGVLVGYISDIYLDGTDAVVEFKLTGDHPLPENVTAEIRSKTVFGEKWIELIPPDDPSERSLTAGSVIPDERTREPLELERALELGHDLLSELDLAELRDLLGTLADGFEGHEASARTALDRGLVALRAANSRTDELDEGLSQLADFSVWLDDNDDNLVGFMASLDSANRALVGAAPEFVSSLQSVPVFLEDLAAFQERTEADLGRLVEDGATIAEIVALRADDLTDIVVQLEAFTTVWNSGLRQPCAGEFEADMVCWQVYQAPGLDSRGLYGPGAGPHTDDPADPQLSAAGLLDPDLAERLRAALVAAGEDEAARDLARLLLAPVLDDGGSR